MLATCYSALLHGLSTIKITIEIALTSGLPTLQIVGLPSQTVAESKERITAALSVCGIQPKTQRTVVNLAPADIRKNSSAFELPIAAGLLQLAGVIKPIPADTVLLGELSLTGELKSISGTLPLLLGAKKLGFTRAVIPTANTAEAALVTGLECYAVENLQQFISIFHKQDYSSHAMDAVTEQLVIKNTAKTSSHAKPAVYDEIIGQEQAKQALEIAAAGGHNLYLLGPPGTGKSMLAESFIELLPPLSETEILEVYSLHSIVGELKQNFGSTLRPFRQIHHTTSLVGLIGGGTQLLPGEISLAHRGVLFMDELPEFPRHILESLRQPLESKTITVSRATGTVQYPANFVLIAAANPCPCGYKGSQKKACTCSEYHQAQYKNKVSGPLLDRIDLTTWVGEVDLKNLAFQPTRLTPVENTLAAAQERVLKARQLQTARFAEHDHLTTNADMTATDIKKLCSLTPKARQVLLKQAERRRVSARQYFRTIKIAQTIADLKGLLQITEEEVMQAVGHNQAEPLDVEQGHHL